MRWAIFVSLLVIGALAYHDATKAVTYSNGQRAYKVRLGDNEPSMLRADRIERRDGCVLFWRQDRIDTILCEGGVGTLIVTEVYE